MCIKTKTEIFIAKAILIHGDKYTYEKTVYINAHSPVIITCKIHGDFSIRPDAHLFQNQGCRKCGMKRRKHPGQKTNEQFIAQCIKKWGNRYDYSITFYVNKTTKIKYICPLHGVIEQLPNLHLKSGCPFCNGRGISRHSRISFINIATVLHKGRYGYDKVVFVRMSDEIIITCFIHGDFKQRAGNHIHLLNGCPACAKEIRASKAEKEICQFIKDNYSGKVLENDRIILKGKEIDIYLPDLKVGIEYNGLFFHSETVRGRKHHYDKWRLARDVGVRLIQIYSNEYEDKRVLIESKILNLLGKSSRIYARNTEIRVVGRHESDEFLTINHLQGSDSGKVGYGLYYNGELVSLMTFGPSRFNRKYKYELLRFCNKVGYSVVGGASKLLKRFRADYVGSIVSYADKRYSEGNLYKSLGFILDGETKPSFSYFFIRDGRLYNRMKFQKQYLKEMKGYDPKLREYEIMQLNGYDRIWDCGQYRFVLE